MTMSKLVYENLAIGVIIGRIGECRFANKFFTSLSMALTQQTPLERRYRDALMNVRDKLIVIEFKAPYITSDSKLVYKKIPMNKLMRIAKIIGEENTMLALIHALLTPNDIQSAYSSRRSGTYMWLATPATTAFIPLAKLPLNIKNMTEANIKIVNAHPYANTWYANTPISTCAKQSYLTKREPVCASCGGLYYRFGQLRTPVLELEGGVRVRSYTLASLLKTFIECRIGFTIALAREIVESFLPEILYLATPTTAIIAQFQGTPVLIPIGAREPEHINTK